MSRRGGLKGILLILLQNTFAWFVQKKASKGHLEVERKFSISAQESESLPLRLRELELRPSGSVIMTDTFLPPREKGEMLRIRDEMIAGSARTVFTYKTWVRTSDGGKERQESEAEVSSFIRTLVIIAGRYLCNRDLLSFSKERALFTGKVNGKEVVACVDRVSGLGQFSGYFLEVESIVPVGTDPSETKAEIYRFVETLFGAPREDIKRSYLEMLELSRQG